MARNWAADSNVCEEYGCGSNLRMGNRHHCRNCGRQICNAHSVNATTDFTPRYQSASGVSRFFTSKTRNTRICETCALRYNLSTFCNRKIFSNKDAFAEWVRYSFQRETTKKIVPAIKNGQEYNLATLYNGVVFRGDSYKTHNDLFREGMTQRSDAQETLNGLKSFSNFIGRKAAGHTGSFGISCTTEFDYAFGWNKASVYVIDLTGC